MTATLAPVDWRAAQEAVRGAGSRVTALLRRVRHPDAPAIGEWDITDVAAHLSHVVDTLLATGRGGGGLVADIWGLAGLTRTLVDSESERDLSRLADRIDASLEQFLEFTSQSNVDSRQTWLVQGIELSLANLTCHLLNELTVHGRDIAVADGSRWPIPRSDAALIVCGFLFPALGGLGGAMVDHGVAGDVRVTFDVHVRGGCRAVLRIDRGDLLVEPSPSGPVDCRLSVDPACAQGFLR